MARRFKSPITLVGGNVQAYSAGQMDFGIFGIDFSSAGFYNNEVPVVQISGTLTVADSTNLLTRRDVTDKTTFRVLGASQSFQIGTGTPAVFMRLNQQMGKFSILLNSGGAFQINLYVSGVDSNIGAPVNVDWQALLTIWLEN